MEESVLSASAQAVAGGMQKAGRYPETTAHSGGQAEQGLVASVTKPPSVREFP